MRPDPRYSIGYGSDEWDSFAEEYYAGGVGMLVNKAGQAADQWGSLGGAVQVDPGFPQLTPRLLSDLETKFDKTAFKLCFQLQPAPLHPGGRQH